MKSSSNHDGNVTLLSKKKKKRKKNETAAAAKGVNCSTFYGGFRMACRWANLNNDRFPYNSAVERR
jgi:hypothetical protein